MKNAVDAPGVRCSCGQNDLTEIVLVASQRRQLLHRLALRYLGNAADAEDAVQDALLLAIRNFNQFKGEAQLSTWLARIVINVSLMKLRRRSREPEISVDAPDWDQDNQLSLRIFVDNRPNPEQIALQKEHSERLRKLALHLPPILRRTYHLRDIHELSVRETARILGVSEATVKTRGSRARAKLRRLMQRLS